MRYKFKTAKVLLSGVSDKRRKYKVRVRSRSSGQEWTKSYHRTKKGAEDAADSYMKQRER